ncbi:ribonuclease P subunit p25 family protein [Sulfolobus acidocaldarius]|uniref:DNA/RNA-binding protein Alba n=4 Tax=Sulfolobus acidocaldarius TaxID=2285 RepID=Q4J974_SULAC|nr:DNA-binding protein [Sulfolobus acidocaldarius]AHC51588.1 DNA-binding protein [Sulfolobus acidocaldarius SUSAZ]AAY80656.1 DNA binding protein alba-1 [Sulfolobus acidocaldarius DSM 639]AGE71252.1 DNA binding protein alba-1 [Sulfolobus acidocaldarius N8]AGE73521.1 DNA binding protein alba-1 [Sulfolobus acidocaldarius Ron12/I]ALU30485.1 DNA-binding protein [Sulfolobus acidocaldarius]
MSTKKPNEIVITKSKRIEDYVLDTIILFNQGYEEVEIRGSGQEINKAIEVYNQLVDRLKEGVRLEKVDIGSEVKDRRRISYILLRLKRIY